MVADVKEATTSFIFDLRVISRHFITIAKLYGFDAECSTPGFVSAKRCHLHRIHLTFQLFRPIVCPPSNEIDSRNKSRTSKNAPYRALKNRVQRGFVHASESELKFILAYTNTKFFFVFFFFLVHVYAGALCVRARVYVHCA